MVRFDGSTLWKVDLGTGTSECLLSLSALVSRNVLGSDGRVGLIAALRELIIYDAQTRTTKAYSLPHQGHSITDMAMAENHVALVSWDGHVSSVKVMEIDSPTKIRKK
jgi:hypothetical protein